MIAPAARSACRSVLRRLARRLGTLALWLPAVAVAAEAADVTLVYRVINAYNGEVFGEERLRIERSDGGRTVYEVTRRRAQATVTGLAIDTADGNGLRRALPSHDALVDFDFTPALPAYVFPLEPGRRWSARVEAVTPQGDRRGSVRVDAAVVGRARVSVPAGSFETVKIERSLYLGDAALPLTETTVMETEWYAPALGRAVRLERTSRWLNLSMRFSLMRGDWTVHELVATPPAQP